MKNLQSLFNSRYQIKLMHLLSAAQPANPLLLPMKSTESLSDSVLKRQQAEFLLLPAQEVMIQHMPLTFPSLPAR